MLKTDHASLSLEIEAAEQARRQYLTRTRQMIRKYAGPDYKWGTLGDGEVDPENRSYEYVSLVLPQIAFESPRAMCKSHAIEPAARAAAEAIKHGLNSWIRRERMRGPLQQTAADMLFGFGASAVSLEPIDRDRASVEQKHTSPGRYMPHFWHIEPSRVVFDPLCADHHSSRFTGIAQIEDLDTLRRRAREADPEEGWNALALAELQEMSDKVREARNASTAETRLIDRGETLYYEVWIPEIQQPGYSKADGYHGSIFTVVPGADLGTDGFIRKPRPYYGPRWGGTQIYGVYPVPGSPIKLSPLVATASQARKLNEWTRAVDNASAEYKRIVFVPAGNPAIADAVQKPGSLVIPIPMMTNEARPITVEIGGVTQQHLGWAEQLRDRVDRAMGMDEVVRGRIKGSGTATEAAIADNASTIRLSFIKQQFAEGVRQAIATAAWFLYHEEGVVFSLGEDELEELVRTQAPVASGGRVPSELWFQGGDHDPDSGYTFEDLDIDIDIMSMERSNEALVQQRTMEMTKLLTELAPIVPQTPFINWKQVFAQLGDAMNLPNMSDMIDEQMAHQIAGFQMNLSAMEAQAAVSKAQPTEAQTPKQDAMSEARQRGAEAAKGRVVKA